jgi:hypothetical protein
MARLELRSTFQLTNEGLGSLTRPNENRTRPYQTLPPKEKESVTQKIDKKNHFGIATLVSKSIFSLFEADMLEISESYASKKLASILNNSFQENLFSLAHAKNELEGFEFNASNPFETGVGSKICLRKGAHKGHMIMHIPAFVPVKQLNVPKEATNFKISARLISVSDIEKATDHYSLINKVQHNKVGFYDSTMLPVLRIPTQPLTAQLSIPNIGNIKDNVSTILVIAIKFYCYKNSNFCLMPEDGMMKIMKVN